MKVKIISFSECEKFRDLKINISKFNKKRVLSFMNNETGLGKRVIVKKEHIINALNMFISQNITQRELGKWAKIVCFGNCFEIAEEPENTHDSIVGVLQNLALIELGMAISDSDIYRYIDALESDIELLLELERVPRPFYQPENIKRYPKAHSS